MIYGTHVIVYSKNADADRAFLRNVLRIQSVDAGHGWRSSPCRQQKPRSTPPMRAALRRSISCATILKPK